MTDVEADAQPEDLVLDYELDAPPEKVWRAISIPAFREQWLPRGDLDDPEPVYSAPGEEINHRMRDEESSRLESMVTFRIRPNADGGTTLRIVHVLAKPARRTPSAANNNRPRLMLAA